jgi:uncharacterized membrane protein YeiH
LIYLAHPIVAILLGAMTASFGGIIRDVMLGEKPIIFQKEIYIIPALVSGLVFVLLQDIASFELQAILAIATGLGLRVMAIRKGWKLPYPNYEDD